MTRQRLAALFAALLLSSPAHAKSDLCHDMLLQGKNTQAVLQCTREIRGEDSDESDSASYYYRALAHAALRQYDQAISDFSQVIEMEPAALQAYIGRGRAYYAKGDLEDALAQYDKVLQLNPGYAPALDNRGDVRLQQGRLDDAIADYTDAIKVSPHYMNGYWDRGRALQLQGKFALAIPDFVRATELNPKFEYPYLHLLIADWLSKQDAKADMQRLRKHVAAVNSKEWARTLSKYYLGVSGVTEQTVLLEAHKGQDIEDASSRQCEAYYYLGVKRFADGDRKGASEYLDKSVGLHRFPASDTAKAMLSQMDSGAL